MDNREFTNVALEHWVENEGYGIRLAWEEGEPTLYLLEYAKLPHESARDTEERILKGSTEFELCGNLECRRLWLGPLNKGELARYLAAASALHKTFCEGPDNI